MRVHKIAAIPGDGIGQEVIAAGLEVLDVCAARDGGFRIEAEHFDWGSDYYRKHGVMMPVDGLDRLRGKSAIYFGAVGAPDVPDHITLWGLRAIERVTADATLHTPDLGGRATTRQVTDAVRSALRGDNI